MIGHWEIIAIVAVILLIFGPTKLPALGRSIGESFKNLKQGLKEESEEKINPKKVDTLKLKDKDKEEKEIKKR